ncbi:MAG: NAD(+)/NADH kinase [Acidimicrobiales bacterium]
MSQVIFAAFSNRDDAVALAHEAVAQLGHEGISAALHRLDVDEPQGIDDDALVVSLGGDGTFLKAARLAHGFGARVLPVDLGRLGFLLAVPSNDVVEGVKTAQRRGEAVERLALEVTSPGSDLVEFALNEVVVERAQGGQMVRVRTFIDGDEYLTYSADGVMVATPTGSTGYSFSCGGPVVDASLQVLILSPIAPHFTIDRSIVVDAAKEIRLEADNKPAIIVADGRTIASLAPGGCVEVRRNPRPVRVVATSRVELGFRLREALRQGHA